MAINFCTNRNIFIRNSLIKMILSIKELSKIVTWIILSIILMCMISMPNEVFASDEKIEDEIIQARDVYENKLDELLLKYKMDGMVFEISELCNKYKELEKQNAEVLDNVSKLIKVEQSPQKEQWVPSSASAFFRMAYNDLEKLSNPQINIGDKEIYGILENMVLDEIRRESKEFAHFKRPEELVYNRLRFDRVTEKICVCNESGEQYDWYLMTVKGYLDIVKGKFNLINYNLPVKVKDTLTDSESFELPQGYTFCEKNKSPNKSKFSSFIDKSKEMWAEHLTDKEKILTDKQNEGIVEEAAGKEIKIEEGIAKLGEVLENLKKLKYNICSEINGKIAVENNDKVIVDELQEAHGKIISLVESIELNFRIEYRCMSEIICKMKIRKEVVEKFHHEIGQLLTKIWKNTDEKLVNRIQVSILSENIDIIETNDGSNDITMIVEYIVKPAPNDLMVHSLGYNREKLKKSGILKIVGNSDGTHIIEDHLHGLRWKHYPFNQGGYSLGSVKKMAMNEWRLPTIEEMRRLSHIVGPSNNDIDFNKYRPYWTSEIGVQNVGFCFYRTGDCSQSDQNYRIPVYPEQALPLLIVSDLKK